MGYLDDVSKKGLEIGLTVERVTTLPCCSSLLSSGKDSMEREMLGGSFLTVANCCQASCEIYKVSFHLTYHSYIQTHKPITCKNMPGTCQGRRENHLCHFSEC